ncbi:protein kinase STUNTED-like [Vicia villosa]|uniref:protein kinase STUNTED-like n=1 Tax=Vicia villosa TaxID=3911 RepID=UPI00273AA1CF|nr:protein kinase STUNTED-like [Vicia villosa]
MLLWPSCCVVLYAFKYFMHGRVTDKIDVYAFGVVLLELLSNRKPINNESPKGQESLVMWATSILKSGKISQLLDPSLGSEYNDCQIKRMVLAATLCIRRVPRLGPQIRVVSPFSMQIHSLPFCLTLCPLGYYNNAFFTYSSALSLLLRLESVLLF